MHIIISTERRHNFQQNTARSLLRNHKYEKAIPLLAIFNWLQERKKGITCTGMYRQHQPRRHRPCQKKKKKKTAGPQSINLFLNSMFFSLGI